MTTRIVKFTTTRLGKARLKRAARSLGIDVSALCSHDLQHILDASQAGLPGVKQARVLLIQSSIDDIRRGIERERQHLATATSLQQVHEAEGHRELAQIYAHDVDAFTKAIASLETGIRELERERDAIFASVRPRYHRAPLAAGAFLGLLDLHAILRHWPLVALALVSLGIAFFAIKRRGGLRNAFRDGRQASIGFIKRGRNAGAPKRTLPQRSPTAVDPRELAKRWWLDQPTWEHRNQEILNQTDGLDMLRRFCDEALFVTRDPSFVPPQTQEALDNLPDGEIGTVGVHLLVLTTDQLNRLPIELRYEASSERVRRNLPPPAARPAAPLGAPGPAPIAPPVPVAPGPAAAAAPVAAPSPVAAASPATTQAPPKKRGPGRPRKQPPTVASLYPPTAPGTLPTSTGQDAEVA